MGIEAGKNIRGEGIYKNRVVDGTSREL